MSSGTYIRALVRDILKKLKLTGTLCSLTRTAVDNVTLDQCDALEDIEKGNYTLHDLYELLSVKYPLVDYENIDDIRNGRSIKIDNDSDRVLIVHDKEVLAVYDKNPDNSFSCVRGLW